MFDGYLWVLMGARLVPTGCGSQIGMECQPDGHRCFNRRAVKGHADAEVRFVEMFVRLIYEHRQAPT